MTIFDRVNIGSRKTFATTVAMFFVVLYLLAACASAGGKKTPDWPAALGWPVAAPGRLRVLHNDGFTIGYEQAAKRAAWVAYRVKPVTDYRPMPRPEFRADPRLGPDASTRVYAGPAYDRGHLAPNYAMAQLYGSKAQRQAFYYSNIAPQRPRLNQLVWQRFEEIEIDDIAARTGALWVLLGPVPDANGGAPAAFYRIWFARGDARDHEGSAWQALAFVVPQRVRGDERLDRFIVSIDRIEALTGLDFLAAQPARLQQRIEAARAPASRLGFAAFACEPARYDKRWHNTGGILLHYNHCGGPRAAVGVGMASAIPLSKGDSDD